MGLGAGQVAALTALVLSGGVQAYKPPPIVILPGFGNAQEDYTNPLERGEETSFSYALEKRGFSVSVVPVKRTDWLKFASGALTMEFWRKQSTPWNPSFRWYLDKVGGSPLLWVGMCSGLARDASTLRSCTPPPPPFIG
jgi:hypothetical protein